MNKDRFIFLVFFKMPYNVRALRSAGHLEIVQPGTEADVSYKS
jgi:hypothetical protein